MSRKYGNIQLEEVSVSIQLEEVKEEVGKLRNRIAPVVDGLKAELLKRLGENGMERSIADFNTT